MKNSEPKLTRRIERIGWIATLSTFTIASFVLLDIERTNKEEILQLNEMMHQTHMLALEDKESYIQKLLSENARCYGTNLPPDEEETITYVPPPSVEVPPVGSSAGKSFWVTGRYAVMKTEVSHESLYNIQLGISAAQTPIRFYSVAEATQTANRMSAALGESACYDISGQLKSVDCTGWRIPTKREWLLFASAEQGTRFSGSDVFSDVGWPAGNIDYKVGSKPANQWGIKDMSGGLPELVYDATNGSYGLLGNAQVLSEMKIQKVDRSTPFAIRLVRSISDVSQR